MQHFGVRHWKLSRISYACRAIVRSIWHLLGRPSLADLPWVCASLAQVQLTESRSLLPWALLLACPPSSSHGAALT